MSSVSIYLRDRKCDFFLKFFTVTCSQRQNEKKKTCWNVQMPCSQQYSFKGIFSFLLPRYIRNKRERRRCAALASLPRPRTEKCVVTSQTRRFLHSVLSSLAKQASKQTKTTTTKTKTKHIFLAKGGPRSQDLKASGGGGDSPASCWKWDIRAYRELRMPGRHQKGPPGVWPGA